MHRASALILVALRRGHRYGFEIMDVTGLASGTVYPALRRMERRGLLTARWEETPEEDRERGRPERRVYRLTSAGDAEAAEALRRLRAMEQPARDLLSEEGG